MERTCANWKKQNQGVIRQLWIGLFPLAHRSLGLLFRVLLLIPALLFSGVASQAWSQITPKIALVATREKRNPPDAPVSFRWSQAKRSGTVSMDAGGIPAYPQNSRSMDLGDKLVS